MKTGEKTGDVVGALTVHEHDEIMLITNKGQMVRTRVKEIRVVGRRISLFNILKSLEELGESPETIAENYELPPGLVREVIAFAKTTAAQDLMADSPSPVDKEQVDQLGIAIKEK